MLKSALRLSHTSKVKNNELTNDRKFEKQKIEGTVIDNKIIENSTFKNFVFSDCGMKETIFKNCNFYDCIFAGCYMKGVRFENCTIRGCHFEICTTTNMKIEDCTIEYVEFFRCTLPFQEIVKNLGSKHSANDRMLLNCATEAHRIGKWKDAELFIAQHLKEKRSHWKKTIIAKDEFYKSTNFLKRLRNFFRLTFSYVMALIFGDNVSIWRMIVIGIVFFFVIGPLFAFTMDNGETPRDSGLPSILSSLIAFIINYKSYLIIFVNIVFGSNLPVEYNPSIIKREMFEIASRLIGITYLAILGNIATKSIGSGPKW